MRTVGPLNSGAAVGADGVATANASSTVPVSGYVVGVCLRYNGAPPAATTDAVVKTVGTTPAPPTLTLLSLTDSATDGWRWPRVPIHKASDGTVIADQYDWPAIDDLINVAIAGANAGDSVDAWLLVED